MPAWDIIYLCWLYYKLNSLGAAGVMWVCSKKCACLFHMTYEDVVDASYVSAYVLDCVAYVLIKIFASPYLKEKQTVAQ